VVSADEGTLLRAAGADPAKVAVVPNGVDPRTFTIERTRRVDTVVYPGSVTFGANYQAVAWFLREVWPRVRGRHPQARFVVTGSTTGVDLAPLQVAGVEFAGLVADIHATVAEAAMAVVPLTQGGGTRLKVLEAFALGTPVVSTSKGAEGLGIAADVHALIADTADAFAGAVLDVLARPAEARVRAMRARTDIAEGSAWPVVLTRLDDVLDEACTRWARRTRSRI
jgi:glycosyltransferase involved in cell wall biosynthesis